MRFVYVCFIWCASVLFAQASNFSMTAGSLEKNDSFTLFENKDCSLQYTGSARPALSPSCSPEIENIFISGNSNKYSENFDWSAISKKKDDMPVIYDKLPLQKLVFHLAHTMTPPSNKQVASFYLDKPIILEISTKEAKITGLDKQQQSVKIASAKVVDQHGSNDLVGKTVFEVYGKKSSPMLIKFLLPSNQTKTFTLGHIGGKKLEEFEALYKSKTLRLGKFDFSKEPIMGEYFYKGSAIVAQYEMSGKDNNIIKLSLKGAENLFLSDSKDSKTIELLSFLFDTNSVLFELQGAQIVGSTPQVKWQQQPKGDFLTVLYNDENGKTQKREWSRGEKGYHGIAGLWELARWMNSHSISEKKFILIYGAMTYDSIVKREGNSFVISVEGKSLYRLGFSDIGAINYFEQIPTGKKLELSSSGFLTETIRQNRKEIENEMRKNSIISIGGELW